MNRKRFLQDRNVVFGQIVKGKSIISGTLRPECTFIHPTKMCPHGDDCTRGEQCTYIHFSDLKSAKKEEMDIINNQASVVASNTMIPCKFGVNCLKPDCPFWHPSAPTNTFIQQSKSTIICKFDSNCLKPACPFSHPSKLDTQQVISPTDKSLVQCKYDPFCAREGCMFKHSPKAQALAPSQKFLIESNIEADSPIIITSPNGYFFPGSIPQGQPGRFKNRSLVLKPSHLSQRGFAVSDLETEKFNMEVE